MNIFLVSSWHFSMLYMLKWLNTNFQSMTVFVHYILQPWNSTSFFVFTVLFCVRTIVVVRIYHQHIQGTLLLNNDGLASSTRCIFESIPSAAIS